MESPSTPKAGKAPVCPSAPLTQRHTRVEARQEVPAAAVFWQKNNRVEYDPFVEPGGPSTTSWASEEDIERNRKAMHAQAVMRAHHQDGKLCLGRTSRHASSSWQPARNVPTDESPRGPPVPAHRDGLIGRCVSSPAVFQPLVSSSTRRPDIPAPVRPIIDEEDSIKTAASIERLRKIDLDTILGKPWAEVSKILEEIDAEQNGEESRSGS